MFCPKCGNQVSEAAQFCRFCGCNFASMMPSAQVQPAQAPAPQPTPQQATPAKQPPKSNNKKRVKTFRLLLAVTFLASMLLLVASAAMPIVNDLFKIPAFSAVIEILDSTEDIDADDLMQEMEDTFEDRERHYESIKDGLDEDRQDLIEESFDTAEDFLDHPSLLNLRRMAIALEEETDEIEYNVYVGKINVMHNPVEKVDTLIFIFLAFFFLPLVFTLLGGLLKNRPLTIVALVLTALAQILLSGWIWFAMSLVIYIAQAILCGKYKEAAAQN